MVSDHHVVGRKDENKLTLRLKLEHPSIEQRFSKKKCCGKRRCDGKNVGYEYMSNDVRGGGREGRGGL